MAITRTPILDDTGDGETGTVLNNAWKQELYDQIDGVAVGSSAPITGGGNISLPPGTAIVRMAPASPVVIAGFTQLGGVVNGQQFILHNVGPSTVRIAHEDVSASAVDRVTYPPSTRGQILGVGGMVRFVYDATSSRWRMFLVSPGKPIDHPYNAADFTASAGTWTVEAGDAILNQYVQEGAFLTWWFRFASTSVSNAGVTLRAVIPGGFSAGLLGAQVFFSLFRATDNNVSGVGMFSPAAPTAQQVTFYTSVGGGGFGVAANLTEVAGSVRFPIQ